MQKVVTYAASHNLKIRLTESQIKTLENAGVWPRDGYGSPFSAVQKGLAAGSPSFSDAAIDAFAKGAKLDMSRL